MIYFVVKYDEDIQQYLIDMTQNVFSTFKSAFEYTINLVLKDSVDYYEKIYKLHKEKIIYTFQDQQLSYNQVLANWYKITNIQDRIVLKFGINCGYDRISKGLSSYKELYAIFKFNIKE